MNKALVLIEALEHIITEITSGEWDDDEALEQIHTMAEDAVNIVGGHEEIGYMLEPLRIATIDLDVAQDHIRDYGEADHIDVKRLVDAIIPVLVAVDDLTDGRVSGA